MLGDFFEEYPGVLIALIAVALVVSLASFAMWLDSAGCAARWRDSGYRSEWSVFGGCRVETSPGRWVPDGAIRRFEGE
jgi:hypothetical protein